MLLAVAFLLFGPALDVEARLWTTQVFFVCPRPSWAGCSGRWGCSSAGGATRSGGCSSHGEGEPPMMAVLTVLVSFGLRWREETDGARR
jgi:hypothetical protein